jgi:2-C-methyl-D-erythritol 4-phosphate cytidylyltransferase
MGGELPKQYLSLAGKTVMEHTLSGLCSHPLIDGVAIAIAPDDERWSALGFACEKPLLRVSGGAERCYSVLNALDGLTASASEDDWVLVHDAARPCLRREDLDCLIETLRDHPVGGMLGVPVRDTMKRADAEGSVYETVNRAGLWHALTPQMFRLGALRGAIRRALDRDIVVTDEAMAMEMMGARPRLIEGHGDNIKVTRPEDLALAAFFLRQQGRDR